MNLLYVIPSIENNGPVNVCLEMIRNLSLYKNINITVLSLGKGARYNDFSTLCTVHIVPRNDIKTVKKIMSEKFDIIHSHCFISDLYSFLFSNNYSKRVTTLHNCFDADFIDRKGYYRGKFEAYIAKYIVKNYYKIACSRTVYNFYNDYNGDYRLYCVPNGFGNKEITDYNWDKDLFDFYYVGSLINRKNVDFLISNFEKWSIDKNVKLHIFGKGNLESSLFNKYQSSKIKFYGHVDNILDKINSMDCVLSASKFEGLPMAIIESMALSKPFICSDIDPHKELYIASNGKAGYLFDLTSDDSFKKALDAFYGLSNQEKQLISKYSYETYANNFSSKIMTERYIKIYEKLLSQIY
ncbi:glycosyltransferase family 4 protein [Acinetobacter sp. YH12128]|uniref:glycosyltransferase family 4 protein n=1 Tax=Acinetobacter sp. YH12128 TaxID=2601113 RepID=UPI0015D2A6E8|nr:glycosyltransferase family 4 protein [Acinetobacter sp. YH12128]